MATETARLVMRRPTLADVPALFAFLGDADAMRYTHVDRSLRQCRRRVAAHERRRRRDGYAPWTIVTKADGRIIGWGGLYEDPFDPGWGVEVGYSFHPAAWGQGYATELAATCTEIADHVLGLPEIIAFAHREISPHAASWTRPASRWRGSSPRWSACSIDVPADRAKRTSA